jgi:hypothetical protein
MNNLDFLNLNTVRNYPIKDGLSCVSTDELFRITPDLIADLAISAPSSSMLRLYISKVVSASESINIVISDSTDNVVGSFFVDYSTHVPYKDYYLTAGSTYPNAFGVITIGYINEVKGQPSGEFTFDIAATELLMRVFTPAALGINYLSFVDDKGNEAHLTGNVRIHAENNLRFRITTDGDETIVNLDGANGLGLNKDCEEAANPPIKTINGIRPDSEGDFHFITADCVSVTPIESGLLISDTCGKPCLGCNELGVLTERAIAVENELFRIRDYVTNLDNLLTQLTTLVNYQCECE